MCGVTSLLIQVPTDPTERLPPKPAGGSSNPRRSTHARRAPGGPWRRSQTAGTGGDGNQAEATLQSVKNARRLRAQIIERRDAIVLGKSANANAAGGGVDFVAVHHAGADNTNAALLAEMRALRESVARIEKYAEAATMRRD